MRDEETERGRLRRAGRGNEEGREPDRQTREGADREKRGCGGLFIYLFGGLLGD